MSFFSNLMGGISSALSLIPGLGVAGDVASMVGQKVFGSMSADDQWQREAKFNAQQAQLNRDFQTRERVQAQQFNLDMWNRANRYNSPSSQLQRAMEAGINPNAVIGGINSGSSSPVSTSPMSGSMASAPGSLAASMLLQDATISNLMANTRKTNADADNSTYELTWNKMTESERYQSLVNMNEKSKAEIAKIVRDTLHVDFDEKMQESTFRWFSQKTEEEINVMKEQLNLLRNQSIDIIQRLSMDKERLGAEIRKINNDIYNNNRQTDANIAKTKSDISVNHSVIALNNSQATYIDQQTDNALAAKPGIEADSDLKNLILEFSNSTGIPIGADHMLVAFSLWMDGRYDDFCDFMTLYTTESDSKTNAGRLGGYAQFAKEIKDIPGSAYKTYHRSAPPYMHSTRQRYGIYNP